MTQTNVIEVKNVWKSFKTVQAVKGITLSIPKGKFVALLGPNGAGKTTLVEMIEGIQKPDKGEITIMGKTWKGNEDELHRLLGLSLQENHFIEKLRVTETLRLFAAFFGIGNEKANEIINVVGLEEKRKSYVVNLSGGQKQRLAIGIALLNDPTILLLDEPPTGLDPNARREIWDILQSLKSKAGTSMILTTHYMEEAEHLCDYIVIIDHGTILREGTLNQLLDDDSSEKVVEFSTDYTADLSSLAHEKMDFNIRAGNSPGQGSVVLKSFEEDLPRFMSFMKSRNVSLKHMECRRKTLDDLFVSLTGRKINE